MFHSGYLRALTHPWASLFALQGSIPPQSLKSWPSDTWTTRYVLYMGLLLNAARWAVPGAPRVVHITLLWHELHKLPVCFRPNWRFWFLSLKPFMAWVQISWGTISLQRGLAVEPVSQGIPARRGHENFFCHGLCPLDNYVPQVKSISTLLAFQNCLKTLLCQLGICLGLQWEHLILEVVNELS